MNKPLTLFEKIWLKHKVAENARGEALLYLDRHYLEETCFICFDELQQYGRKVRRPDLTFIMADHTIPTRNRSAGPTDPEIRTALTLLDRHLDGSGIRYFGPGDPRQGIIHVLAPELGLTLPGLMIACDDSHTTTHGAFGALALGIGTSESTHVLATQTLWQPRYKSMRVHFQGRLSLGITAKDLILALIGRIGAGGAVGHVVEFAGPAISAMSMDQRMTLCNMAVEAGARAGLIAPDETTINYVKGRPCAPAGALWDEAVEAWSHCRSDPDAAFDRETEVTVDDIAPMVTWGTSPEDVAPITGIVPDPSGESDVEKRRRREAALAYMGLMPGTRISDIRIDRVFIGSCTNGRLDDLRKAAAVAKHGRAVVPAMVVPGSTAVKQQAEAEGLDRIFLAAGFEWLEPGCSMCVGMNGDIVAPGERCASTTNRNFVGRQGPGSRTHLMSPAMAAAAALTGRITDVRQLEPT